MLLSRPARPSNSHFGEKLFKPVVTPLIVGPGQTQVIPLVPEFVRPQDGHDQQDCEHAAVKRWLAQHGERFGRYF